MDGAKARALGLNVKKLFFEEKKVIRQALVGNA